MKSIPRTVVRKAVWTCICAIALGGCGMGDIVVEPAPPSFTAVLVEPLPLRVAYEIDPDVDREVVARRTPAIYHFRLGPATRRSFEPVLKALFPEAVPVPAGPQGSGETPTIRVTLRDAYASPQSAAVWYVIELGPAGGPVADRWVVKGVGDGGDATHSTGLAIRDAAATVARGLPDRPAMRAWLEASDEVTSRVAP